MILCVHCGQQNKEDSLFCTSCGNGLSEDRFIVGHLRVLSQAVSREYLVSEVERSIGREAVNDIVIDDAEMSGRHAKIRFRGEGFWVEDLNSTNGTFVNGDRIFEPTFLHDEDLLKMGRTLLQLKL